MSCDKCARFLVVAKHDQETIRGLRKTIKGLEATIAVHAKEKECWESENNRLRNNNYIQPGGTLKDTKEELEKLK